MNLSYSLMPMTKNQLYEEQLIHRWSILAIKTGGIILGIIAFMKLV